MDDSRYEEIANRLDEAADSEDELEIRRLAALSPLAYDRERTAAAKRLGCRGDTLDKLVRAARGEPDKGGSGGGAALEFPEVEPWPEPVECTALLSDLARSVKRFVSLSDHAAAAVSLWTASSYIVVGHGHIAPILAVTSPEKRCGKSTLLDWLFRIVARPLMASNITAAAVFRTVDACQPTLIIDEADSFLGENGDELRGILNSGHSRHTAFVIRVAGEELEPRKFSTWGAKAIALIGKLEGRYSTLADRSIEIQLRRKLPSEKLTKLRHAGKGHFDELARRCARFAADYGAALGNARPDIPDTLNDRAADNWELLFAIADLASGTWPRLARTVAGALAGDTDNTASEGRGVQLLSDLRDYFNRRRNDTYSTEELLRYLHGIPESPWPCFGKLRKPMTARNLSELLRPFKIIPRTVRISGADNTPKGYHAVDFQDAFSRYLPYIRHNATSQTNSGYSSDSIPAESGACGGYENTGTARQKAGCDVVADKTTPPPGGNGKDNDLLEQRIAQLVADGWTPWNARARAESEALERRP